MVPEIQIGTTYIYIEFIYVISNFQDRRKLRNISYIYIGAFYIIGSTVPSKVWSLCPLRLSCQGIQGGSVGLRSPSGPSGIYVPISFSRSPVQINPEIALNYNLLV